MKHFPFASACAILLYCFTSCKQETPPKNVETKPVATQADLVKHGEYIVNIAGCNDCHSPKIMTAKGPEPDPARLLSGHPADEPLPAITDKKMIAPDQWALFNPSLTAAVGPWGTTFAANLTPDETGMANWTEAQFFKAMREGKQKGMDGTRPLLPPMPWPNLAKMTDEDLRSVFVYLQSLKPVKNAVPNPIPPAM